MRLPASVSTLNSGLSSSISNMRSRMDVVSQEAVTGRQSDLVSHLNGKVGGAMLSQKAIEDVQLEKSTLSLRGSRLDVTQRSLTAMTQSADGLGSRLTANTGGLGNDLDQARIVEDAKVALDQVFFSLSAKHGERFLFSGDATATPPFADKQQLLDDVAALAENSTSADDFEASLKTYFEDPAGGWQTNIYQGTAESSDPDSITPLDPAITQMVAGLAVAALASPTDGPAAIARSDEVMQRSASRINSSQISIIQRQADLGIRQEQLSMQTDQLNTEELLLTESYNALTSKDQYEAAVELQQLETNLEAAYLLTSRIADLSLLNYLR